MAVRIVEGVPGGGKTYYVVHHLLHNFFEWDTTKDWWVSKVPDLVVLSNIDGLKVGSSLLDAIQTAGGPAKFFNYARMKNWIGERKLVLVIDEAQNFFDRRFYDKEVAYFFQMHRHLGIEIYLVTQDVETLAKELRALCEYRVQAARRVLSLTGEFRYRFIAGDGFKAEAFKTKILRRDQKVFAVYRSMSGDEVEKLGSAPRRMVMWLVLLFALAGGGLVWWRAGLFGERAGKAGGFLGQKKVVAAGVAVPSGGSPTSGQGLGVVNAGSVFGPGGGGASASIPVRSSLPVVERDPGVTVPVVRPVVPSSESGWDVVGVRRLTGVLGEADSEEAVYFFEGGEPPFSYDKEETTRGCRCQPQSLRLGAVVVWWEFSENTATSRASSAAKQNARLTNAAPSEVGREPASPRSVAWR